MFSTPLSQDIPKQDSPESLYSAKFIKVGKRLSPSFPFKFKFFIRLIALPLRCQCFMAAKLPYRKFMYT